MRLSFPQPPSLKLLDKTLTQSSVIILSRNERVLSTSLPNTVSLTSQPHARLSSSRVDEASPTADLSSTHRHYEMGSKASKLSPKNGKLQSSQEKKDKEEMKEPTNYYTHRSKSMRRKAGRESAAGGAGGVSMGSGGAGGAI